MRMIRAKVLESKYIVIKSPGIIWNGKRYPTGSIVSLPMRDAEKFWWSGCIAEMPVKQNGRLIHELNRRDRIG